MNIQNALNRGFNLLAISITGLVGFAFLPEVFVENDVPDKLDDGALFIVGLVAIVWYRYSQNRYVRSVMPVALVVIAALVKLSGLLIEIADPESFGDDIGGLILLVLATALVISQYKKTGKLASGN